MTTTTAVMVCALLLSPLPVESQCPNASPLYQDLETWVHGANNTLLVQVTMTNPPLPDGSHFYTAWGKACLHQGVAGYGQCRLTTNPIMDLLFSDRTYPSSAPDNSPARTIRNVNQPFSVKDRDAHLISLDMVGNTILSKSIKWNFEVQYTNLTRRGDVIFGEKDGSVIVLNLSRVHVAGSVGPNCSDW
jgi:hypothetical protein